jgi:hypothetical protein
MDPSTEVHSNGANNGNVTEGIEATSTKYHVSNPINSMAKLEESPAKRLKLDESSTTRTIERPRGTAPIKAEYVTYPPEESFIFEPQILTTGNIMLDIWFILKEMKSQPHKPGKMMMPQKPPPIKNARPKIKMARKGRSKVDRTRAANLGSRRTKELSVRQGRSIQNSPTQSVRLVTDANSSTIFEST